MRKISLQLNILLFSVVAELTDQIINRCVYLSDNDFANNKILIDLDNLK
jgi:hypothetical protein